LVAGTTPAALAQFIHDPPWNGEHIDHLPAEIRGRSRCEMSDAT
jgi:hypothetical protein